VRVSGARARRRVWDYLTPTRHLRGFWPRGGCGGLCRVLGELDRFLIFANLPGVERMTGSVFPLVPYLWLDSPQGQSSSQQNGISCFFRL